MPIGPTPNGGPHCIQDGREAARAGDPDKACAASNRNNVMSGKGGPDVTPFTGGH